jgi:ribose 5-phosphate isomerase A
MADASEAGLRALGETAAGYVESGMRVGLGTGRAATAFVRALGARVRGGLKIVAVPTSESTRTFAESLGIPLTTLADAGILDLTIDGADEVDPRLDLIKGLGGALVREKIVAASSKRFVVVIGEAKLVPRLGVATPVPVEVVPFGRPLCERRLAALSAKPTLRSRKDDPSEPYLSDNCNYILDAKFPGIDDARKLDAEILAIPGVVGTGLFVGMTERVLVLRGDSIDVLTR